MRRLRRAALAVVIAVGAAGVAGWATGGLLDPPVVAKPRGPRELPPAEEIAKASCRTPDGLELRGLFFPSDPDAPLVVHFMESGVSPVVSGGGRHQYQELSARGFASLAIDYRGIGDSDGARDHGALRVDAHAIWDEALRRVGGDESRLLVRATSLGSVATAWVLSEGARPAAVMLHAPVEAESVIERFGSRLVPLRWIGVPMEFVTRPFLRDWEAPATLATALGSGVPLLVSAHVDDPLLSATEIEGLRELADEGALVLHEPERVERQNANWPSLLDGHFDLSIQALHLSDVELTFLDGLFPALPPLEQRAEELLMLVDEPERARALLEDAAVRARLQLILSEMRRPHRAAAVAAAVQLTEEEIGWLGDLGCRKWLLDPLAQVETAGAKPEPPSLDKLLEVFDLGDDPEHRDRILRGLDRGRAATLARVRHGDGRWWTAAELRDAFVRVADGAVRDDPRHERPDLALLAAALPMMKLDMGLFVIGELVPEGEEEPPGTDEMVLEALLRAAWL